MSVIVIRTPRERVAERKHAIATIFGEWLGVVHDVVAEDRRDTSISLDASRSSPMTLRLPDTFFQLADSHWMQASSLPSTPLHDFDAAVLQAPPRVTSTMLPILFGENQAPTAANGSETHWLPIDVLGSTFFMLSRYEEIVTDVRDKHGRFPATASVAHKGGFLERPIIDEYVEVLWAAMKQLWPSLQRKEHKARVLVSCDVDHPFLIHGGPRRVLRRLGGDFLVRRSLSMAVRTAAAWPLAAIGNDAFDEFRRNIDWMMAANEKQGNRVAFYFIPENTHSSRDRSPSMDEPRMRRLLRSIHERGHEIGFHPGYCTYRYPEAFERSISTLRRVMDQEGIDQFAIGGRQHYLRWDTAKTARLWEQHGLDYDSTLSYADHAGFRCGTCREFALFDLTTSEPLRVRERPLVVMDASVIDESYMGLGHGERALEKITGLKSACLAMRGDFSLLWHNSYFDFAADREIYTSAITQAAV